MYPSWQQELKQHADDGSDNKRPEDAMRRGVQGMPGELDDTWVVAVTAERQRRGIDGVGQLADKVRRRVRELRRFQPTTDCTATRIEIDVKPSPTPVTKLARATRPRPLVSFT